jgi:voltage-gated sodium channel
MSVFVSGANGVGALRAIRVLRVLRLLTVLPNLQRSVIILSRVIAQAAPFLLLVLFMYYVFALLGMQLFGASCKADDPNAPTFGFGSLWTAILAVFLLSLGDLADMFSMMSCSSGSAAVFYIVGARPS